MLPLKSAATAQPSRGRRWLTSPALRALSVVGPAAVVVAVAVASYHAYETARDSRASVAHSRDVIERAHQVLADLVDAETGQRGFLLTGEDRYLEPYQNGIAALRADTAALRRLTIDDPAQQQRVDRMYAAAAERGAVLDSVIALRRATGLESAVVMFRRGRGRLLMDSVRDVRDRIDAAERRLLAARLAEERRDAARLALILIGGATLAAAFALLVNAILGRLAARVAQANAALEVQAVELEAQQSEVEAVNQQLQDQQEELEMQAEELRAAVAQGEEELAGREAAHRQLAESEARLRRIADAGVVGIFFWTVDGRIEEANDAFLSMLGYDRHDLALGRIDWRAMTPPEYAPTDSELMKEMFATGAHRACEKRYIAKDGRHVPVLIASALFDRSQERGICVCVDISAQKTAETEREALLVAERAARAEAENANRSKGQFLASMSHELRTPLNAIGGYADLIDMGLRGPVTHAQREDLARIKRSGQHLLSLINDILNYARLEAGRVELQPCVARACDLVSELEDLVEPQVRTRGLELQRKTADECAAWADAEKVQQILLNLATNAVKFTEPGGRITVSYAAVAEHVHITVADTGRGIPPEKLDRIFEPFIQVDRHLTHASQQGVGLGLTISRDLARAMGGDLTVESTPGVGSAFTLILPRADMAEVAAPGT